MDFRFLRFAAKVTVAHVVSSVAYRLLTKSFDDGCNPVFSICAPIGPETLQTCDDLAHSREGRHSLAR
jgi:hypothetical protein